MEYINGKSDLLTISFDSCEPDIACLMVARVKEEQVQVVNEFTGNEAKKLYEKLVKLEVI